MKKWLIGVFCVAILLVSATLLFLDEYFNLPPDPSSYTRVIILAGQSNMVGGARIDLLTPEKLGQERYEKITSPFENVKFVCEQGFNDTRVDEFTNVTLGIGGYVENAFGPEIGFAEELSKCKGTTYLIKCAFSGTYLRYDWQSPSMSKNGIPSERYNIFTNFIDKNLKKLEDAGLNPKIVGLCWMQGEADASEFVAGTHYKDSLTKFVGDLRRRYNKKSINNRLNFFDATIHQQWPLASIVNEQKYEFAKTSSTNHIINTLEKGLIDPERDGLITDTEPTVGLTEVDPLHYDTTSVLKLGNMFAQKCREIGKF